jgi:hypothetical protein
MPTDTAEHVREDVGVPSHFDRSRSCPRVGEQFLAVVHANCGAAGLVLERVEKPGCEDRAHALAHLVGGQPGNLAGLRCGMGRAADDAASEDRRTRSGIVSTTLTRTVEISHTIKRDVTRRHSYATLRRTAP